jgi:hypothetical protein
MTLTEVLCLDCQLDTVSMFDSYVFSLLPQVGANQYLDPSTGKVWTFNHLTRQFGEETDKKQVLSDDIEARRAAVQKSLTAYLGDLYKPNKATLAVYGADNGTITVCLSAKNVNLSNFWSVKKHCSVDAALNVVCE